MAKKTEVIVTLAMASFLVGTVAWGNNRITTTRYDIVSDKVSIPLSIVQVSDFHGCKRLGEKMLHAVKAESPQIIVITGDFIDGNDEQLIYTLKVARDLTKIAQTYYITGNHETLLEIGAEQFKKEMESVGVKVVDTEGLPLRGNIRLYGIDDPSVTDGYAAEFSDSIASRLKNVNGKHGYHILLSHRPEAYDKYRNKGYDLTLSGHAHGGQFRIPLVGGFIAPHQGFFPKYDSGIYSNLGKKMIVSRGVGDSIIPIRINNTPEIVSITVSPWEERR